MDKVYPIAEVFDSLQGEGSWSGTRMRFIRLAGCTVGKYYSPSVLAAQGKSGLAQLRTIHPVHSVCTDAFGNEFLCDTDYRRQVERTPSELLDPSPRPRRICLTGGEPYAHDLLPLMSAAWERGLSVHVETSGTIPIPLKPCQVKGDLWITCSPKQGFLQANVSAISEWKLLVDGATSTGQIINFLETVESCTGYLAPVFLQPVGLITQEDTSGVHLQVIPDSALKCITLLEALQDRYPNLRLSLQIHKYLCLR